MSVTADERTQLSNLFDDLGPDAPTLCGDWTTRDLVAHLLVRERRPDAAGGVFIPALAGRTERVMAAVAQREYPDLVHDFRVGPPIWSPLGWPVVGDQANLFEFFVHHEDVRRAQPDWQPRPVDATEDTARDDALWKSLRLAARVLFRHSPVGVVLSSAGHGEIVAKKAGSGQNRASDQNHGLVTLVGLPGEIVLIAFGRSPEVARVIIEGTPADVDAFVSSERGL